MTSFRTIVNSGLDQDCRFGEAIYQEQQEIFVVDINFCFSYLFIRDYEAKIIFNLTL
jgi:hypothetical protein